MVPEPNKVPVVPPSVIRNNGSSTTRAAPAASTNAGKMWVVVNLVMARFGLWRPGVGLDAVWSRYQSRSWKELGEEAGLYQMPTRRMNSAKVDGCYGSNA